MSQDQSPITLPVQQLDQAMAERTLQLLQDDIKRSHLFKQNNEFTERETLTFGYDYFSLVDGDNSFTPIPDYITELCQHCCAAFDTSSTLPSYKDYLNVIVSIYRSGYQLEPHIDVDVSELTTDGKPVDFYFGEHVLGVILHPDDEGKLYMVESETDPKIETEPFYVLDEKLGTAFLINGLLRRKPYFHGVSKVKDLRISVTFRTVTFLK